MFNLKIGNIKKEYDLTKETDCQVMFSNLFLYYSGKFPFFTNVLITIADIKNVEENNKSALAYTYYDHEYERIKIHINYDMIANLKFNADMIMFVIFHEYLHNYYYHFIRMKTQQEENPSLANAVTDYYVNELLYELFPNINDDIIKKYGLCLINQQFMERLCESNNTTFPYTFANKPLEPTMYEELKKILPKMSTSPNNKDDKQNQDEDNNSNGNSQQQIDDHELGKQKEKENMNKINKKREKEGKPKISEHDMQTLAQNKIENVEKEIERSQGIGKGDQILIREKEKIMKKNPFLNTLKLKRIINSKLKTNTIKTYKRISRKRDNSEIIFKGKIKQEGRKVVVALDVSGSISDKDLKMFYEMLNGFLDNKKIKTSLDVIYWSDCDIKPNVNFHQNIKDVKDLMKLKIHSSGGTSVEYLHDFIKDYYGKQKEKIVLINITDGYFYIDSCIPKECVQYYFILTEPDKENEIIEGYKDSRVMTEVIKEVR